MTAGPPSHQPEAPITQMLSDVTSGRPEAPGELLRCVYEQLRVIANNRMAGERSGHTLQATALVNEAYLRLVGNREVNWRDRGHFYSAAAEAMRRILIDHARRRGAEIRGGGRHHLPLDVCDLAANDDPKQILALDQALLRLQEHDAGAVEIVRLRFFAGLNIEEIAVALGVSESTVNREWTFARAMLYRFLEEELANES